MRYLQAYVVTAPADLTKHCNDVVWCLAAYQREATVVIHGIQSRLAIRSKLVLCTTAIASYSLYIGMVVGLMNCANSSDKVL